VGKRAVIKGSGDVFADLSFSPAESRNLRLRSQMMTALRKFIEREGLTQSDAAKLLTKGQPAAHLGPDARQDQSILTGYAGQHAQRRRPGGRLPHQAAIAASGLT